MSDSDGFYWLCLQCGVRYAVPLIFDHCIGCDAGPDQLALRIAS